MAKSIRADDLFDAIEQDAAYREAVKEFDAGFILARNVLRLRVHNGWSQEELARRAEMRQPRIAELESGKGNPRLDTITRIAAALDVSIDELFADGVDVSEGTVVGSIRVKLEATAPRSFTVISGESPSASGEAVTRDHEIYSALAVEA
jgi:transcriptional regulator with XRE-family HTH domain